IVKKLGGGVRLALAQYRELAAFAQFASDLDESTRKQLERGQRVMEVMKQPQYSPMSVAQMAVSLFAVDRGYLDDVELSKAGDFESGLQAHMESKYGDFIKSVNEKPEWNDDVEKKMKEAVEDFKKNGTW
ncbi:MAG: F0F1 ATP synthase subunit alpha, partial [Gammaproteobacteria bacterium]|nr:F0F1 ATP synthase subunit alpha [Gammaproteobacteria bacterium]